MAQRFKLPLKPPLSFVVANGNKPRVVTLTGLSKPEDLEKKLKPLLALEIKRIDALKQSGPHFIACTFHFNSIQFNSFQCN